MLRSIAPVMNVKKNSRGKSTLQVFLVLFYLSSLTFGYLWYSFSFSYATNDNSENKHTIRGYLHLFADQQSALHACARVNI